MKKIYAVQCFDPRRGAPGDIGGSLFYANHSMYADRKLALVAQKAAEKDGLHTAIVSFTVFGDFPRDANVTKDGVAVEVGQVWRDLDKRMGGKTRTIAWVKDGFAYYNGPRKGRIAVRRMHKHSTGFSLVS